MRRNHAGIPLDIWGMLRAMALLVVGAGLFLTIHLVVSGTPLRGVLIRAIGDKPYNALFALASLVGLVIMGVGFHRAAGGLELYDLGYGALVQTTPVTLVAFELIVMAFVFPNPTAAGGETYLTNAATPPPPVGVQHITRHPMMWGIALWAASHLVANGSLRDIVLFGTLLVTAAVGTFAIDAKRRRALGSHWTHYASATSNIPFVALLLGRTRLAPKEFGWWRPLLPLVFFAVFYATHGLLFGAPLPPKP